MFTLVILICICAITFLSCNGDMPAATSPDICQSQPMAPHTIGDDLDYEYQEADIANHESHGVGTESREPSEIDSSRTLSPQNTLGKGRCDTRTGFVRSGPMSEQMTRSIINCDRKLNSLFRAKYFSDYRKNCSKLEIQNAANTSVDRLVYVGQVGCGLDDWNQQLALEAVRDQDSACGLLLTSGGQDGLINTMDDILYFSSFSESMSALLIDCLDDKQKKTCASLATCRAESEHEGTSCPDYCIDFYGRKLHCTRSASARWKCISTGDDGEVGTSDDIDDIQ